MADAVAAPRMHTDGNMDLRLEESCAQEDARAFRTKGYKVETGRSATISAAAIDLEPGRMTVVQR